VNHCFQHRITRTSEDINGQYSRPVEVEIAPEQPERVVAAVAELVQASGERTDPWWQAGLEEALET